MPAVREKPDRRNRLVEDTSLNWKDESPNYPTDKTRRATFRTKAGKKVTAFQWAVYDFTRKVPRGRVTTYKDVCAAIGQGSPRSVGSALRRNPFAPTVPCHRVIASNHYVGGFFGEWGPSRCSAKIHVLSNEGVEFTTDGYLATKSVIWRG
ncbi:methylated-DNA--cysteine S-met [Pisolithus thermaeus]|nr:methylated-DNA--cysteine S-met [Pisolithus croceorrhizus]KAI6160906.1 methylated-DNA--cysteine S-met [Pisolithus thermaeus]